MSKFYKVPVYYQVCEYVTVKAENPEQARQWVEDHQDDIPTHLYNAEANYIDESYEVEQDVSCVYETTPSDEAYDANS